MTNGAGMRRLILLGWTLSLTACAANDFWSAALVLLFLLPACFQPPSEATATGGGSPGGGTAGGGGGIAGIGGGVGGGGIGGVGGGVGGGGFGGVGGGVGGGGSSGTSESCCRSNPDGGRIGTISTCFCPGTMACNYGMFISCGNDTCVSQFSPRDGGPCDP